MECKSYKSIPGLIEEMCLKYKCKAAIHEDDRAISYFDLNNFAKGIANDLINQGIRKGEIIALQFENSIELVIAILGILYVGAVPMILHPKFPQERVDNILAKYEITRRIEDIKIIEHTDFFLPQIASTDPAIILLTSGSTVESKCVVLSHENIISNTAMILSYLNLDKSDRVLLTNSLAHSSTFTGVFLVSILCGSTLVIYKDMNLPGKLLKAVELNSITYFYVVPTFLRYLMRRLESKTSEIPSSLNKLQISGEILYPQELLKLYHLLPSVKIFYSYGLTEMSPRVSVLIPMEAATKLNCVGRVLKDIDVKIVDENYSELSVDKIGEIALKGPTLMLGYLKDLDSTNKRMVNGFFLTGDKGWIDKDGYLYVIGRLNDMMIRGGYNISPLTVENVLIGHEAVQDVIVFANEDKKCGQTIFAFIVPSEGGELCRIESIRAFCKRKLAEFEMPDEILWVHEIPKTPTGKRVRNSKMLLNPDTLEEIMVKFN